MAWHGNACGDVSHYCTSSSIKLHGGYLKIVIIRIVKKRFENIYNHCYFGYKILNIKLPHRSKSSSAVYSLHCSLSLSLAIRILTLKFEFFSSPFLALTLTHKHILHCLFFYFLPNNFTKCTLWQICNVRTVRYLDNNPNPTQWLQIFPVYCFLSPSLLLSLGQLLF